MAAGAAGLIAIAVACAGFVLCAVVAHATNAAGINTTTLSAAGFTSHLRAHQSFALQASSKRKRVGAPGASGSISILGIEGKVSLAMHSPLFAAYKDYNQRTT
jgi:hypothetical protein